MKNVPVGAREAEDLDAAVARVLRELAPDPPLRLGEVRELLKLDRHYFSSTDTGFLSETISRLRRAGNQIVQRPTLLIDAIQSAKLAALWLPDKRRILIDEEVPPLKKRWAEAHEIGHSLPDWHKGFFLGDDRFSLSRECHEKLENEANYAAGQLLFLQGRFVEEARSSDPTLDAVLALSKTFQNTKTSTLWRFVEGTHPELPLVGIVSVHPRHVGEGFDPSSPCRYVVESDAFRDQFSATVSESDLFGILRGYCNWNKGGPLGAGTASLPDANGREHVFRFETFSNTYDALTLGAYVRPREAQVVVAK